MEYLIDRYIEVNDSSLMIDGIFIDNPFYSKFEMTRVVGYLIGNEGLVKGEIRRILRKRRRFFNILSTTEDECYRYVLDYFSERPHLDFQPNYFDGNYKIGSYIFKLLPNIVNSYLGDKKVKKELREVKMVEGDEDDSTYQGTLKAYDLGQEDNITSRVELSYFLECFDYLYLILNNNYPVKKERMYKGVNKYLVYDLFLDYQNDTEFIGEVTKNTVESKVRFTKKQEEEWYNKYNFTPKIYKRWIKSIKDNGDVEDVRNMVKELILPIEEGNFTREDLDLIETVPEYIKDTYEYIKETYEDIAKDLGYRITGKEVDDYIKGKSGDKVRLSKDVKNKISDRIGLIEEEINSITKAVNTKLKEDDLAKKVDIVKEYMERGDE